MFLISMEQPPAIVEPEKPKLGVTIRLAPSVDEFCRSNGVKAPEGIVVSGCAGLSKDEKTCIFFFSFDMEPEDGEVFMDKVLAKGCRSGIPL